MFGSPTPVTHSSLATRAICLILWVPFLAIGWEQRVPVRTCTLLAPSRVCRYRSLRTAPSRSRGKVPTSLAGAQHPAMISRTLIWHHSHYWEVPLLTARAQVDAADTAFVIATLHDATLVSMPAVIAVVGPTSIGYGDGDPSSRSALAAASNVSVGSCDASLCPGLLFCKYNTTMSPSEALRTASYATERAN